MVTTSSIYSFVGIIIVSIVACAALKTAKDISAKPVRLTTSSDNAEQALPQPAK